MTQNNSSDLTRTTLAVLFIGILIAACFWVMRPFLSSLLWAAMIVIATWPFFLELQTRLWGKRWLAVLVITVLLLLVLIIPICFAVLTILGRTDEIVGWFKSLSTVKIPPPPGGYLEQADGTAWMALFSLNMLEMNIELAMHNEAYADMAIKFVQHFCSIASATIHAGGNIGMWDEEDGFFYDVLQLPDGKAQRLKVHSMVGLLPLCAVTVFEGEFRENYPDVMKRFQGFLEARPELSTFIHDPNKPGHAGRRLGAILDETKLRRVLAKMLDENEFLSAYGLRALSRYHADHPYVFPVGGQEYRVSYVPGESDTGMFGGNSNWRGPIWMPVNALIIRALLQYYTYYGNEFTVECPTGSGKQMNLYQVAEEITRRLVSMFLTDKDGRRPVNGSERKYQDDPHWRDCIQFYEYFHGDTGVGVGASHQTGWTGVIAQAMHLFATLTAEQVLEGGKKAYFEKQSAPPVQ